MKRNLSIVELCKKAMTEEASRIVAIYNEIVVMAKRDKLIYTRRVHSKCVGVHRKNREGSMVSGREAMRILDDIDKVGVTLDLLKDATAFEEPETRINESKFLVKCATDDFLANYDRGSIEVSSVSCSHFNQAMAAVIDGLSYCNPELCIDGRLSAAKIVGKYPLLDNILAHGLEWHVWKRDAEVLYPDLPDIAQRALNAKYTVHQTQDCFQMLGRAVQLLNSEAAKNKADKMQYAVKDILKSNPQCSGQVVSMIVETARKFCGTDDVIIEPLLRHVAAFKPPGRVVSTDHWKALASMKFASTDLCPHFIMSILMTLACADPPGIIASASIKTLPYKMTGEMKACEALIKQAYNVVAQMCLPPKDEVVQMGWLRVSLVLKLFGKIKSKYADSSYIDLASEFFVNCVGHQTSDRQVQNPWNTLCTQQCRKADKVEHANDEANDEAVHGSRAQRVMQYDSDGNAVGVHRMMVIDMLEDFPKQSFVRLHDQMKGADPTLKEHLQPPWDFILLRRIIRSISTTFISCSMNAPPYLV